MKPRRTQLNIQAAVKEAELYCGKKNLSVSKLRMQKIAEIGDNIVFAQPVNIEARRVAISGLKKDKESQPKPTLILKKTGRGYIVEETEYTNVYLK